MTAATGQLSLPPAILGQPRLPSASAAPKPCAHRALVSCLRPPADTGSRLQFHTFDAAYVEGLCAGDLRIQDHFVGYFTRLLRLKLRARLRSPQAIEDVCQETFARVLVVLRRDNALQRPERLGAFVNTVCNNVLFEHYRAATRHPAIDMETHPEPVAPGADPVDLVAAAQLKTRVREILLDLAPRDRALLQAVFIEERDREEVCREMGVDGEYLRVLLFRARQNFKTEYLRRMGPGNTAAEKT